MFNNVVIGVDGRAGGREAIALAGQLATPGAQLTLAHVYGGAATFRSGAALAVAGGRPRSQRVLTAERELAAVNADLASQSAPSVACGLREVAERRHADLLVVGSCHRGLLGRTLLGDNTDAILDTPPCPVAIAPVGYAAGDDLVAIGVGYDGSPESEVAVAVARALRAGSGAAIKALSIVGLHDIPDGDPIPDDWPEAAKRLMDERLQHLHGLDGVDGDVTYGEPTDVLALYAETLDLLIIGSRSHGPVARLFNGSASHYVARQAGCPVIVIPRSAIAAPVEAGAGMDARAVTV